MKSQKILLAWLFSLFCTISSAQYNTKSEWYIGPSTGITMSNINLIPKLVGKLNIYGKTGGISTRYISENHLGFQLDLNYFEAGWKEDLLGLKKPSEYSYSRKLNFIEVPFLMHVYTGSKATRAFLNIGPKFSYLLSESEVIRDFTAQNNMRQHGLLVDKPFQYGLLGGVGFEFHLKRSVIGLEGRYSIMLTNLFDDAIESDNFTASSLQTTSLSLFYYVQIGKTKK